jgi:uncharacterized protein (TIGR00251 family)
VRAAHDGVTLAVWVTPGAARSECTGVADGRLRIRLAAPAREGRANEALVRFVAELLGVTRQQVTVIAGATGRRKLVSVAGRTVEQAGRAFRL